MLEARSPHANTVDELQKLNKTMSEVLAVLRRIEGNTRPRPSNASSFASIKT
jgi:hypothetical protein